MKKLIAYLHNLKSNEEGQTLVETAISILTFLMVVLGIMQLALIYNGKFLTNYAAYCGARAAIISNNDAGSVENAACVALSPNYNGTEIVSFLAAKFSGDVNVSISGGNINVGNHFFERNQLQNAVVIVRVDYWFTMIIPFVNKIIADIGGRTSMGRHQIRLGSTYTMRMQSDSFITGDWPP